MVMGGYCTKRREQEKYQKSETGRHSSDPWTPRSLLPLGSQRTPQGRSRWIVYFRNRTNPESIFRHAHFDPICVEHTDLPIMTKVNGWKPGPMGVAGWGSWRTTRG